MNIISFNKNIAIKLGNGLSSLPDENLNSNKSKKSWLLYVHCSF